MGKGNPGRSKITIINIINDTDSMKLKKKTIKFENFKSAHLVIHKPYTV